MSRLYEIVAESLLIDVSEVHDGLKYNSITAWDSVAHMTLIAALEDGYNVFLETDDIIAMSSVAEIRKILKRYNVDA